MQSYTIYFIIASILTFIYLFIYLLLLFDAWADDEDGFEEKDYRPTMTVHHTKNYTLPEREEYGMAEKTYTEITIDYEDIRKTGTDRGLALS